MSYDKKKLIIAFQKARGLLDAVIKMTEEDRYCIDIMQQNLAAVGLLRSAHQTLMENHLKSCFKEAMAAKNEEKKKKMVKEILTVTHLFNR